MAWLELRWLGNTQRSHLGAQESYVGGAGWKIEIENVSRIAIATESQLMRHKRDVRA